MYSASSPANHQDGPGYKSNNNFMGCTYVRLRIGVWRQRFDDGHCLSRQRAHEMIRPTEWCSRTRPDCDWFGRCEIHGQRCIDSSPNRTQTRSFYVFHQHCSRVVSMKLDRAMHQDQCWCSDILETVWNMVLKIPGSEAIQDNGLTLITMNAKIFNAK